MSKVMEWTPTGFKFVDAERIEQWNGKGSPPAGTECEHQCFGCSGWSKATVIAYGAKKTFYRDEHGHEWSRLSDEMKFRPIRTPEQIAAEEIQRIREEIGYQRPQLGPCPVEQMYLLGYRKFEIVENEE